MAPDPGSGPHTSSNAFARQRDRTVLWLLERHPATAGMLAEIRLFPSAKKAGRRLYRLAKRGQVRLLGTVSLKAGRPEHVYGKGRWKADNLLHEVQLTHVLLRTHAEEVRRGPGEVDPELLPDAELSINGDRYLLELDRGTVSYADVVRRRFARYRFCRDLVLWVCPSGSRAEGLRRHADIVRETALFTTLDQALADPHAAIWVDADGGRAALPRARMRREKPDPEPVANPGAFAPPGGGGAAPFCSGGDAWQADHEEYESP